MFTAALRGEPLRAEAPLMSVVVCTNRGPEHLRGCLEALQCQSIRKSLELIVVDDGAPEPLACLCEQHEAKLLAHPANLGLAAARNTGWRASSAPIVAFTDDDCRPERDWAANLLGCYDDPSVLAAGGEVRPSGSRGLLALYYELRPPIAPLEAELGQSSSLRHRLKLYLLANLASSRKAGRREVYSLAGASMSVRRQALLEVGGFDPGIRFGGEDEDFFYRLRKSLPGTKLVFEPAAVVEHEFRDDLRDLLRRARAYGRGCARNFLKHPGWGPTFFPVPVAACALAVAGTRRPAFLIAATLLPAGAFPRWSAEAVRRRDLRRALLAWLQLLEEAASDVGFIAGLVAQRNVRTTQSGIAG